MNYFIVVLMGWMIYLPAVHASINCARPLQFPLSSSQLKEYLAQGPVKSIDEFVNCLPPQLKQHFTLIKKSEALFPQCADELHPRIILFSEDARWIISVPGDLKFEGCNQIEFVESNQGKSTPLTATLDKKRWKVEEPNTCVRCHTSDFHHIWNGYPYWPGVYGENDDQITKGSQNAKAYAAFLARKNKVPRYRSLKFEDLPAFPYSESFKSKVWLRPNLVFSSKLVQLNALRIIRKWKESKAFEKSKWRILSLLADCQNRGRQIPKDEKSRIIEAAESAEREKKLLDMAPDIIPTKTSGRDSQEWFSNHIQVQFAASRTTIYDLENIAEILSQDSKDWLMSSDENKSKNYGTVDLDGKLRQELLVSLTKDLDAKLMNEFKPTELCNSPDKINSKIYTELGFECRGFRNKGHFCANLSLKEKELISTNK